MSNIPYDKNNPLSINVNFWCDKLQHSKAFMSCPSCKFYPCEQLVPQDINILNISPLMNRQIISLILRKIKKMYIAKKNDGSFEFIETLDEKNPNPEQLRDVEEIYVIAKTLVPVMILKPKPKNERDQLINENKTDADESDQKA